MVLHPFMVDGRRGRISATILRQQSTTMNRVTEKNTDPLPDDARWHAIAASPQFKDLLSVKKRFILPAFVFFLVYFFALPLLVGYAPKLMSTRVFGAATLAFVFALSQFVVGGVIAALYLGASANFDALSKHILAKADESRGDS
jgi:uncharacterized membrane protein (DUF485 family)